MATHLMVNRVKRGIRRTILRSRDFTNTLRYGPRAPKYAELIWVKPKDIRYALVGHTNYFRCSGKVIDITDRFRLIDVYSTPRIKSCFAHWVDGVPWETTDDHAIMMGAISAGKDWGWTEDDLRERYVVLDRMFQQTRETRRLKTRKELDPKAFREEGGILVCIGPDGEPLLYDGFHRFGIALILELPLIPAQLGYVDRGAIGAVERYRAP
jgi:hypothetical protein